MIEVGSGEPSEAQGSCRNKCSETHRLLLGSAMKTHSAKFFDRCPILPNRHKSGGVTGSSISILVTVEGRVQGADNRRRLVSGRVRFSGQFPSQHVLKLQVHDQISASLSQPRWHIGASRHFCPATSLHQLLLFPGAFRYEYGLLRSSAGSLPELTGADRRQCSNDCCLTAGLCPGISRAAHHPTAPTEADNRQCDGSSKSTVQCWFDYIGSHLYAFQNWTPIAAQ